MGLLKRITNSLGRQADEEPVMGDMTGSAPAAPSQQRRPLSAEASLYAPRRGQLDERVLSLAIGGLHDPLVIDHRLLGPRILGAVTPVGGLLFMAGWIVLAIAALSRPKA